MFRFAHEEILYGFILIPLLVVIYIYAVSRKKKAMQRFASPELRNVLMPDASHLRQNARFVFLIIALSFLIFALAGPRTGSKLKEVKKKGSEVVIALDVSRSMLAEDLKPDRLDVAKQELERLIDRLDGDKIGLIVFAGKAYTQIPITTDYGAARLFLNSVSTDMVSEQGTNIGAAIDLAVRSFPPARETQQDNASSRSIIVITDGENHEPGVFEAATKAKDKGIVIHTIGLGDPSGVPIPVSKGSHDYIRDKQGNVVVSKLDENTLKRISSMTNGFFIKAGRSGAGLSELMKKIEQQGKEEITAKVYSDYAERYQYFLGAGLFFLFLAILTMERRNRWLDKIKLFNQ